MSNYMRDVRVTSSVADAYKSMYAKPNEDILNEELIDSLIEDVRDEEINDWLDYLDENKDLDEGALADKAKKSGISVGTLRKVYNRGMAAWKTGHRPGTTAQQWGYARVNAFISKKKKGKLNHDQDLAHIIHPDDNMLEAHFATYHTPNQKKSMKDFIALAKKMPGVSDVTNEKQKNKRGQLIFRTSYKTDKRTADKLEKQQGALEKKYKEESVETQMDEALKPHEKIISKTFKTTNKIEIKGIDRLIDMSSIGVVQAMQKQNPRGFTKTVMNLGKLKENFESLDEVKRQEVDAMKKVSKDMQKVLVSYQKIANVGDKELKDTKHNKEYKKVLDARDSILKMIGTLNTKMLLQKEGKGKNFAQQAAIAIAKKKSGKYDKDGKKINASHCSEDLDEKVKDGKLDPLSKMGKSKLTGQEINRYYRENPKQKAAARDKTVKKAIELALDLSGATNYAIKEIEKLKKGLSKLPAVKLALQHANESKEFTGHHVVIEQLSGANMVKLKTYGKMMAKMTKLPFDENDPEKGIDKLMGQVWKQKHVPANWERLHKMVMMLKGIGVKMPSLKGKYMGLDPVSKKAIFYKEGTDEMVDWHQKIDDIKEGIEELVEKSEMKDADIKKIEKMTDRNDHTGSLMHLAKLLGDKKGLDALKGIMMTHKALGHMPEGLMKTRNQIYDNLMRQSLSKYSNHKDVISSF